MVSAKIRSLSETRRCLRTIRDKRTLPSTILTNGKSASFMAHNYVLKGNTERNLYKRKQRRQQHGLRKTSFPKPDNS